MRRAVLYLRVSTLDQTAANQDRELRQVAERMGVTVVKVYRDHGVSGAKVATSGLNSMRSAGMRSTSSQGARRPGNFRAGFPGTLAVSGFVLAVTAARGSACQSSFSP